MRPIKFHFLNIETGEVITDYDPSTLNDMLNYTHLLPMQFTGRLDSQGKEIYERHIVKGVYKTFNAYFDTEEEIEFTSDVRYHKNGFAVRRDTLNDEGRRRDYGYQLDWDSDTVEIVGVYKEDY